MRFLGISPYLSYPDAGAALEWLEKTFGFGPAKRFPDHGSVGGGEISLGPSITAHVKGADKDLAEVARGRNYRGRGDVIIVHVDDVKALHARVVGQGVHAEAPEVEPYGPCVSYVVDPLVYMWAFWEGEAGYG